MGAMRTTDYFYAFSLICESVWHALRKRLRLHRIRAFLLFPGKRLQLFGKATFLN